MTLDELRQLRPEIGAAVYAYTPGGPVTFELHMHGELFSFTGPTEAAAIAKAFPPTAPPPAPQPQEPETNIFD